MPKKLSNEVPKEYPVCSLSNCILSKECLHHIAYNEVVKRDTYIRLINPDKCSKNKECKFFRSSKPVVYARGFMNMKKNMYPDQYHKFMYILVGKFGKNPFYERRKGEYAMPPQEQKTVIEALQQAGVDRELKFDRYEENANWYD